MTKPTVVTLPLALLLLDYWPLGRPQGFARLVWEKLPLLTLASASGVITLLGQQRMGATQLLGELPLPIRVGNALCAYAHYLGRVFWPHPLTVFYPYRKDLSLSEVVGAGLLLALITTVAISTAKRRPYFLVGWLWFLGVLVPTIGIVQAGMQASADRYTYLPSLGLFVALVWAVADAIGNWRGQQRVAVLLAASLLLPMGTVSWAQAKYWRDSITLFQHAIQVTPDSSLAHHHLASGLAEQGQKAEALIHWKRAVRLDPQQFLSQYELGRALLDLGRVDEAISCFSEALRLKSDYGDAHYALAMISMRQERWSAAEAQFTRALRHNLMPEFVPYALNNLGFVQVQQGKMAEAVSQFAMALQLKPDFVPAHKNFALALVYQNRLREAVTHLSRALEITHGDNEIREMLHALDSQPK